MKKILFIFITVLISVSASAQKWYVATTGNDGSGNGSEARPWLTVKHAADTVTQANGLAGDTIYVLAGTYNVGTQIALSDSIHLMGVMTASDTTKIISTVPGTNFPNNTFILSSAEGTVGNQSISYIKLDGSSLTSYGAIYVVGRSKVSIHHCVIVDFDNNGVIFNANSIGGTPTIYATNNSFYSNYIENCSKYTTEFRWLLSFYGQDGFLTHDNTFIQKGRGRGLNGTCIKLVNGYDKNCKIYDNYIESDAASADLWSFAIETWNQTNLEIYGNTIKGIVDIAGYSNNNTKVYNNIIGWDEALGINSYGMIIEASVSHNSIYVYRNTIRNVNIGIIFYPTANSETYQNINIYYNLIYDIGKAVDGWTNTYGITGYSGGRTGWTINGLNIYNNIIKGLDRVGSYRTAGIALWNEVSATFKNIDISNNIIMGWDYACISNLYTGDIDVIRISNNISYDNAYSNDTRFNITPTNYTSVAHIKEDPLFVGTGTPPLNYKLQYTSPAKDAGISVGLTTDYGGYSVPVGSAVDIGAWEYGADVDPPNWTPQGIGWQPIYYKVNARDTMNFRIEPLISGTPLGDAMLGLIGLDATVNDLNATEGATGNLQGQLNLKAPLSTPTFTGSITVAGDTTVTAVVGKVVYQAADSSFYGCRSTVATKKWYKLHD